MVCSDPEVLKRLDRFVPTTGYPGHYSKAAKNTLEYRLVYQAMLQTPFGPTMDRWHVQGLYIITPSGKLLSGGNAVSDAPATVREMDRGLEKYESMPREERLLPKAPDPLRDRVVSTSAEILPPADGLILRMVSRGLPCDKVSPKDTRHEFFYKLDRVWYTQKEARAFIPSQLKVGIREPVRKSVFNRLALLYLGVFVQPNLYWQSGDPKEATLTAEVTAVKEDSVEVRFEGRVRMEGSVNKRAYDADLLGMAVFRLKSQTLSAFELLAIGNLTLGPWEEVDDGAPRTAPMGVLFTLNGKNANDQVVPTLYPMYSSGE